MLIAKVGGAAVYRGIQRMDVRMKYTFYHCAADFSLLNLPKGKSLGRSKPATNS